MVKSKKIISPDTPELQVMSDYCQQQSNNSINRHNIVMNRERKRAKTNQLNFLHSRGVGIITVVGIIIALIVNNN
jgi:hypothetical protein